jgi:hypothetical protein
VRRDSRQQHPADRMARCLPVHCCRESAARHGKKTRPTVRPKNKENRQVDRITGSPLQAACEVCGPWRAARRVAVTTCAPVRLRETSFYGTVAQRSALRFVSPSLLTATSFFSLSLRNGCGEGLPPFRLALCCLLSFPQLLICCAA